MATISVSTTGPDCSYTGTFDIEDAKHTAVLQAARTAFSDGQAMTNDETIARMFTWFLRTWGLLNGPTGGI